MRRLIPTGNHTVMNGPEARNTSRRGRWAQRACLATLLAGHATGQTVELRQTSVPLGIVNQVSAVPLDSVATTLTAAETSTTYTFCYWTFNAVRWADPSGGAQNPASFTVAGAVDAVAKYVPTSQDSDEDGLPDWWEYRYLGDLSQTGADNPDGDAFINSDEYLRGLPPQIANLHEHGACSRRRSEAFAVIQNQDQFVRLTESSSPAGVIAQSRVVPKGITVALTPPPTPSGSYSFTGWFKEGLRFDRTTDFQPITVTPLADMNLVARYTLTEADDDFDGFLDWKELLWFNDLEQTNASDPDGDGFTIAQEEARVFSSLAADDLVQGGLSRRRSGAFYVDSTGRLPFRVASDPATILDQTQYLPIHSLVTVPDQNGASASPYLFSWWDLDGARQQDASGAALTGFQFTLELASVATAHFVDPTVDSDYDGIKDWQEWTYFGSLANRATSDTDGDGFSFEEELKRGQAPQVANELAEGGISRRRSVALFVDVTQRLSFRTTSNPVSILDAEQYLPAGSLVNVADVSGSAPTNYQFSWWSLNGVRQQDPSGAALKVLSFALNQNADLVGNYIDPNVDSDYDEIKDWHEWTYFGTVANGPTDDSDGDGFTYAEELARNQAPQVVDTLAHGGISRRRSEPLTVNPVVLAAAPEIGVLGATNITSTSATINALINPMSAATTANFEFGPTTGQEYTVASESLLNGFTSDSMAAALSNLQSGTLYYFRVIATNSLGTKTSIASSFRTLGNRSGYEQWRLIYSLAESLGDDDADGVKNLAEYAFGMNPTSASDFWKVPMVEFIGGRLRLSVTEPLGVSGIAYGAEWTQDFVTWTPMSDSGSGRSHEFLTPAELIGGPCVFVRWAIQTLP